MNKRGAINRVWKGTGCHMKEKEKYCCELRNLFVLSKGRFGKQF